MFDAKKELAEPILVFVHGTGDTTSLTAEGNVGARAEVAVNADGSIDNLLPKRWWQLGSRFDMWLTERLVTASGKDLTGDHIERFIWSGANSEVARENAAKDLLDVFRKFDAAGRSIHVLAHSHGGNVVRRALEVGSVGRRKATERVRSVTSFGVPFFHYSFVARVVTASVGLLITLAMGGATAISVITARNTSNEDLQLSLVFVVLVLGGITAFFLKVAVIAMFRIFQRRSVATSTGNLLAWKNYCATKDEAISLLMSLNEPVRLMQRRDPLKVWMKGPLGWAYAVTVGSWTLLTGYAMWGVLISRLTLADITAGLVSAVIALIRVLIAVIATAASFLLLSGLIAFIFTTPVRLANRLLDYMITSRLRMLAYGADAGNGVSGVERFPWPGAEQCWVKIPPELEASMEEYVATRSQDLWRSFRSGLVPELPLMAQDFKAIVHKALTGDELAHTVYYQVEGFAGLIASTLAATGDWKLRSDGVRKAFDEDEG